MTERPIDTSTWNVLSADNFAIERDKRLLCGATLDVSSGDMGELSDGLRCNKEHIVDMLLRAHQHIASIENRIAELGLHL